ncbi:hypothetical protein HD553DRAFT_324323 [Filobasidium floriforme]|uniref:uncharacterized protein n=1 Tax=Filobasidium floriforme TaxID=5210 RepID=UPI001E8DB389|nr:uncharacterized protein HD553DRAFT_324323 [Filobasidium floriforme]KAH8084206.1 hypothetical protein HD553DRAFT_324323 [Filobasidium floriforme]
MTREETIAQKRMKRAGRFSGDFAPEEAIKIFKAIIGIGDPKFQRAKVIPSSGRGKVYYNVHLAMTNASWKQTIPLIIDDVTVNVITDEPGELDPRLSSAIEAAIKSFCVQDETPISSPPSITISLPVRTASQHAPSSSSSSSISTAIAGNGDTDVTSISTMSLVLRPGDKKGKENAAQVDLDKQEFSDSGSDDGWDKIGEDE